MKWLQEAAKQSYGQTLSRDAASLMIELVGEDLGVLDSELTKVATFVGQKGKIELDDVKLIKAFNDDKTPLVFTAKEPVPPDAVTASASGLDPHISPGNADVQAARIAKARNVSVDQVKQLIAKNTDSADLGFLGEPRVNVLMLNLAIDQNFPVSK